MFSLVCGSIRGARRPAAVALIAALPLAVALWMGRVESAPTPEYQVFAGNVHSHTANTWSHGEQWEKGKAGMKVVDGVSQPLPTNVQIANLGEHQGPPARHFALAKENGYDFYMVTDHSQEAPLNPVSPTNAAWVDEKKAAADATTDKFVGIPGFEYSENNGPGGNGHINVWNSAEYVNALMPGVDLPYFYKWLKTARPNGDGPVVASFNHPGGKQYNDWDYRDPEVTEIVAGLEVINSNKGIHYEAFVNALDKGWKVSPVCGNDNHGFWGISRHTSRTFVLATERTKAAILDALAHRRTYASLEGNIRCRYTVNGAIMGSTLEKPGTFQFDITVSDPDAKDPNDKITQIDIVKDGGAVVQTYTPTPDWSLHWSPTIEDSKARYFFVRVWNASGGDLEGGDPKKPVAWLAPVWTGR